MLRKICLNFVYTAPEDSGFVFSAIPLETPMFSRLSPHQRLQLVKDLAVGLLCLSEPLPPQTLIHYTSYRALVFGLTFEIGCEISNALDDLEGKDGSSDILLRPDEYQERPQTAEEREKENLEKDLVIKQAEKYKGRLEKRKNQDSSIEDEYRASFSAMPIAEVPPGANKTLSRSPGASSTRRRARSIATWLVYRRGQKGSWSSCALIASITRGLQ